MNADEATAIMCDALPRHEFVVLTYDNERFPVTTYGDGDREDARVACRRHWNACFPNHEAAQVEDA